MVRASPVSQARRQGQLWEAWRPALQLWAQRLAGRIPREALAVPASQILETVEAARQLLLEEVCMSLMLYQALMRGAAFFSCAVD